MLVCSIKSKQRNKTYPPHIQQNSLFTVASPFKKSSNSPSKLRCSIYFSNRLFVFLEKINLIHHGLIRVSKSQGTNSREDSMEQHIQSLKYTSFSVSMTGPQITSFFTNSLKISVSLVAFKTSLWQSRHRTKKPFLLLHHLAIFPS